MSWMVEAASGVANRIVGMRVVHNGQYLGPLFWIFSMCSLANGWSVCHTFVTTNGMLCSCSALVRWLPCPFRCSRIRAMTRREAPQ